MVVIPMHDQYDGNSVFLDEKQTLAAIFEFVKGAIESGLMSRDKELISRALTTQYGFYSSLLPLEVQDEIKSLMHAVKNLSNDSAENCDKSYNGVIVSLNNLRGILLNSYQSSMDGSHHAHMDDNCRQMVIAAADHSFILPRTNEEVWDDMDSVTQEYLGRKITTDMIGIDFLRDVFKVSTYPTCTWKLLKYLAESAEAEGNAASEYVKSTLLSISKFTSIEEFRLSEEYENMARDLKLLGFIQDIDPEAIPKDTIDLPTPANILDRYFPKNGNNHLLTDITDDIQVVEEAAATVAPVYGALGSVGAIAYGGSRISAWLRRNRRHDIRRVDPRGAHLPVPQEEIEIEIEIEIEAGAGAVEMVESRDSRDSRRAASV